MLYSEVTKPASRTPAQIGQQIAHKLGVKTGLVDNARRAATPHVVDCMGLDRDTLTKPGEFEREFHSRRDWCQRHAPGAHEIEPLGPNPEELIGRRFRFADPAFAKAFGDTFKTLLP